MPRRISFLLLSLVLAVSPLAAQSVINLNAVIGPAGTDASTVDGVGNRVNFTGYALDPGATTLTAVGSTGSSSFNFNTGFADTLDRAVGSAAGGGSVFSDKKFDSSTVAPLILDTNNDGAYAENAVQGFGMHADSFITFDLDAIRTYYSLAAGTPFTLTGIAGVANYSGWTQTSAAIIVDSTQRAVFDWTESGPINDVSSFSLSLSGSARYVTFIGLSGLDGSNWGGHVGFGNVQLQAVPEPSALWLLGAGLGVLSLRRFLRA